MLIKYLSLLFSLFLNLTYINKISIIANRNVIFIELEFSEKSYKILFEVLQSQFFINFLLFLETNHTNYILINYQNILLIYMFL